MNWSPRSMNAMVSLRPRSGISNSRPHKASASSMLPTSSATWLMPTRRALPLCCSSAMFFLTLVPCPVSNPWQLRTRSRDPYARGYVQARRPVRGVKGTQYAFHNPRGPRCAANRVLCPHNPRRGVGPRSLKNGQRVLYHTASVIQWAEDRLRSSTSKRWRARRDSNPRPPD